MFHDFWLSIKKLWTATRRLELRSKAAKAAQAEQFLAIGKGLYALAVAIPVTELHSTGWEEWSQLEWISTIGITAFVVCCLGGLTSRAGLKMLDEIEVAKVEK
ncbi:hypothetical protein [Idiomarina zobellii]|mgnify:CR=1 FL=1|uniref:Holin n=1 Tax=Idiomarina zobellii TaxID=86103 RepID=A0A837NI58_9GAMM|nr:hypothetical protein [Idiomarina zobellii]KPD24015.1 hypothetical protein AFK76_05685 [Idiomarina zobellii]SDF83297.1 hypothetical protein SAMN04515658_10593 [Idiomarina zobellii]